MGKLLLDSRPLVIAPELAEKIGLHEAIILQQVHYWIVINIKNGRDFRDGYYWTYNSYPAWQKQFPFWSIPTIKRTFAGLEKTGLLISGNFNKTSMDRTKWYRIDYEKLESLIPEYEIVPPSDDSAPSSDQNDTMESINLTRPVPESSQGLTTNNKERYQREKPPLREKATSQSFALFWKAYPKRKSKGQAERAFKKINPDEVLLATMLAAIEVGKKSADWLKDDGQFIPYPATWLNARGWEDEFQTGGQNAGRMIIVEDDVEEIVQHFCEKRHKELDERDYAQAHEVEAYIGKQEACDAMDWLVAQGWNQDYPDWSLKTLIDGGNGIKLYREMRSRQARGPGAGRSRDAGVLPRSGSMNPHH